MQEQAVSLIATCSNIIERLPVRPDAALSEAMQGMIAPSIISRGVAGTLWRGF